MATACAQEGKPPLPLPATTVQLPTFGISIDAEGTLDARTFRDFDGKLLAAAAGGGESGQARRYVGRVEAPQGLAGAAGEGSGGGDRRGPRRRTMCCATWPG